MIYSELERKLQIVRTSVLLCYLTLVNRCSSSNRVVVVVVVVVEEVEVVVVVVVVVVVAAVGVI